MISGDVEIDGEGEGEEDEDEDDEDEDEEQDDGDEQFKLESTFLGEDDCCADVCKRPVWLLTVSKSLTNQLIVMIYKFVYQTNKLCVCILLIFWILCILEVDGQNFFNECYMRIHRAKKCITTSKPTWNRQ